MTVGAQAIGALIDRPPLTEGWHLVLLIVAGMIVVAILHWIMRRQVALAQRRSRRMQSEGR